MYMHIAHVCLESSKNIVKSKLNVHLQNYNFVCADGSTLLNRHHWDMNYVLDIMEVSL